TKLYGAISNLGGVVLDEVNIARHGTQGEESFNALTALIDALLASPKVEGRRVRGIGVGAPGITLHKQGIVKWAYTLGWQDFLLKARLAERYSLPITVDNDVNLAALGELWFGAGQNCQNMILVAIGTGIGSGGDAGSEQPQEGEIDERDHRQGEGQQDQLADERSAAHQRISSEGRYRTRIYTNAMSRVKAEIRKDTAAPLPSLP
ncbi:MAG TPA: ROK family protein, partial [Anaerolineales bacterium]